MFTKLNLLPWPARLPIKWLIFFLTVFLVHFPHPQFFLRHVSHWRNPNDMIRSDLAALEPLVEELRPKLTPEMLPPEALKTVEKFVYDKVKYGWDWDVWGNADYLPTLGEVLEKRVEDCDGRAVVAASLLRRFGYRAEIVTDFAHVWVKTDKGETMSPGKKPIVAGGEHGIELLESIWRPLLNSTAYGIAVFPVAREIVIVVVLWILLIRPGTRMSVQFLAMWMLISGLVLVRAGGANYQKPILAAQVFGLANVLFAVALQLFTKSTARCVMPAVSKEAL